MNVKRKDNDNEDIINRKRLRLQNRTFQKGIKDNSKGALILKKYISFSYL